MTRTKRTLDFVASIPKDTRGMTIYTLQHWKEQIDFWRGVASTRRKTTDEIRKRLDELSEEFGWKINEIYRYDSSH